ncbi:hypothetical protein [Niabella sp.]|uniref:hypothetical protein n=1 Tax=Niabella sp. TaxID=1962976 RepID=UPI00261D07B2|nr:hypothetical protein [Niabella sp.]
MRKLFFLALVACFFYSCSKSDSRPDQTDAKQKFDITSVLSPDSVAIKQTFDADVSTSVQGQYSYKHKLSIDGQVVATKEGNISKMTFETTGFKEGVYKLEVSAKNNDGTIKVSSKNITILKPIFGVAIFGNTKQKVVEAEKGINARDPYNVLIGLESKLNSTAGVEKVMFKYGQTSALDVYYFKDNKFIGAESYPPFLSNGNYYATYYGIKQNFDELFNVTGIVDSEKFSYFTKTKLDDLLNKHDYATISTYVSNGQYSVSHKWDNGKMYADSYIKIGYQNAVIAHSEIALK